VVSHDGVLRAWVAVLLRLPPARARQVSLGNASISVVLRRGTHTIVAAINEVGHLPDG
jgi:broad specificity phosphatase PhoE